MTSIRKIRYDCRQATYLIEKGQHTSLSLKERVRLLIHLAGCSVCRLFRRQSKVIDRALGGLFRASAGPSRSLDEAVKRTMQERINERMGK